MAFYLGILLFSLIVTSLVIIPFINLLYKLHITHRNNITAFVSQESETFNSLEAKQKWKYGTPVGGGILVVSLLAILFALIFTFTNQMGLYVTSAYSLIDELNIIFFTLLGFGLIGLYDDLKKIFPQKNKGSDEVFSVRKKNIALILLASLVAGMLYRNLNIEIVYIPFIGAVKLGIWVIPIFTWVISTFSKAVDVTDGLDGLAGGVLLFCLLSFWAISFSSLDTILSIFLAIWMGCLMAFLYFNVYPARIWLGNVGSLSFGATLAVVGVMLGKTVTLVVIGGFFLLELLSLALQLLSIKFRGKKLSSVTPIHYWLINLGWEEPKVVMRLWLVSIPFAVIGLWFSL